MNQARELILEADRIARTQGFTQAGWSKAAGRAESGQTVSRILSKGECKLGTMIDLLKPLGYKLTIWKEDQSDKTC